MCILAMLESLLAPLDETEIILAALEQKSSDLSSLSLDETLYTRFARVE